MTFIDNVTTPIGERKVPITIGGSGRPLLFVHGYPLNRNMWSELVADLSRDYLCIAPDLRGFGDAAAESTPFTLGDLAADLKLVLESLQVRRPIVLVGLSMGGYVAFEFWARFTSQLAGLVLCNTRASADTPPARQARLDIAAKVYDTGVESVTFPMINRLLSDTSRSNHPELIDRLQSTFLRTAASTIAQAQTAMANRRDFTDSLALIQVPTLVISGERDPITPRDEMVSMAQNIPGSTFCEIADAAHLTPMETPVETIDALRSFLQGLDA